MRKFGGLFKLGSGRNETDPDPGIDNAPAPEAEPERLELEVIAYAEDCILTGTLPLAANRLSDYLNEELEFALTDVSAQDLAGNPPIEVADIVVERDELLLVQAAGPRGDPNRRSHTRQHPIVVTIGPYEVRGLIHTLPGIDPIENLRRRRTMVALTDATIDFSIGLSHVTRQADVVIVNRECVDSIVEAFPSPPKTQTVVSEAAAVAI